MKLVRSQPDPPERRRTGWPVLVKVAVWIIVVWVAFVILSYLLGSSSTTPVG
jgi:hypothetical protein